MRNIKGEIMETCEMKYTKAMRAAAVKEIIRIRKKDAEKLAEEESILEVYRAALGMS